MKRFAFALILGLCCFTLTGCEEYILRQELAKNGVTVTDPSLSVTELRKMLADVRAKAASNQTNSGLTATKASKEVDVVEEEKTCEELIMTTPRGLACLHCMEPAAREQADKIITTLENSCLRNIAINYLVDGTFSFDLNLLGSHIERLTAEERKLFLYLYISNGASQRRYDTTDIESFGTKTSPFKFRELIKNNQSIQNEYRALVRRLLPALYFAQSRGAQIGLVPMLEDNLDDEGFSSMLDLVVSEIPGDLFVSFGRNACKGCYSGNEDGVPAGVFEEVHVAAPFFSTRDGLVTNDGFTYSSPANRAASADVLLRDLRFVRDQAASQNNSFILWSAIRQGLPTDGSAFIYVSPKARSYATISEQEQQELIYFLRGR